MSNYQRKYGALLGMVLCLSGFSSGCGGDHNKSETSVSNHGQVIIDSSRANSPDGGAYAEPLFQPNFPVCPSTSGECAYVSASSSCSQFTGAIVSAGTVTVSSTTATPPFDVTISPSLGGGYAATPVSSLLGGEQIHIAAAGDTVPAFSADVTAPSALRVNSPTFDATGVITASIQTDLVITLSGGTLGVTMDVLASTRNGTLSCSVDSQKGQLTIPAAALAALGAGNQFSLYTTKIAFIPAGDWSISVGTIMDAMSPDGALPITVLLQ